MNSRLVSSIIACLTALLMLASPASAQSLSTPTAGRPAPGDFNPLAILAGAASALPGQGGATTATDVLNASTTPTAGGGAGNSPTSANKGGLATVINVLVVLTVIAMVPSILLMCTCFVRMVIVLGLLKQALGAAQMPPSQVLLGLTLILTMIVMAPTIDRINAEAVKPWQAGTITDYQQLWDAAKAPVRDFMFAQIEHTGNWSSVYMILNYRGIDTSDLSKLRRSDVDMVSLVPAFVLSELKVAFLMGFRVYLPFLVIDMVISSLLISMSMMMLPPAMISLPFKLLLFVLVDGWNLVCGSLMKSFTHNLTPELPASAVDPIAWLAPHAAELLSRFV